MSEILIKTESLPERCEICHQSDCFNPNANYCSRCNYLNDIKSQEIILSPKKFRNRWIVFAFYCLPISTGILGAIFLSAILFIGTLYFPQPLTPGTCPDGNNPIFA